MVQAYWQLLKDWKDVKGRIRRDRFWEAFVCDVFIVILLVMLSTSIGGIMPYVQMGYQIVTAVPFITAAIRRLHDTDKSGWLMLLMFVPFFGWVALAYILCAASNPEGNQYGANPYEPNYYHL